jgi:hypothetical protein
MTTLSDGLATTTTAAATTTLRQTRRMSIDIDAARLRLALECLPTPLLPDVLRAALSSLDDVTLQLPAHRATTTWNDVATGYRRALLWHLPSLLLAAVPGGGVARALSGAVSDAASIGQIVSGVASTLVEAAEGVLHAGVLALLAAAHSDEVRAALAARRRLRRRHLLLAASVQRAPLLVNIAALVRVYALQLRGVRRRLWSATLPWSLRALVALVWRCSMQSSAAHVDVLLLALRLVRSRMPASVAARRRAIDRTAHGTRVYRDADR